MATARREQIEARHKKANSHPKQKHLGFSRSIGRPRYQWKDDRDKNASKKYHNESLPSHRKIHCEGSFGKPVRSSANTCLGIVFDGQYGYRHGLDAF